MQTENTNKDSIIKKRIYDELKNIYHFSFDIPLPPNTQMYQYSAKFCNPNKKSKLNHKYDRFTYYNDLKTNQILKILFLDDNNYVDQGYFPFTQPLGKLGQFNKLNVKRIKTTEAAYIGHINDSLIIKKMQGVKIGQNGSQLQTVDQKFEVIKIGNQKRFNQFLKLMSFNKNSIGMSIRVIIQESENNNPKVIDYQFFQREKQIIKKHLNQKNK